jgi:2-oxoglutarate ferredoxin oxidoreductase subunit beta
MLEEAERNRWLITGLIYVDPDQPALYDYMNLVEEPLNRVPAEKLRPSAEALQKINQAMG